MNIILHNQIADLGGREFLQFYLIISLITLIICKILIISKDKSINIPLPRISEKTDPLQIAYLSRGIKGAISFTIFSLIKNGFITTNSSNLKRTSKNLTDIEKLIYDYYLSHSKKLTNIFRDTSFLKKIKNVCTPVEKNLQRQVFLFSENVLREISLIIGLAYFFILGLGGYKLSVSLLKGYYNVIFLIMMMILFSFLLPMICKPPKIPINKRGKKYLETLKAFFGSSRNNISDITDSNLISIALFGISAFETNNPLLSDYNNIIRDSGISSNYSGGNSETSSFSTDSSSDSCSFGGSGCGGCGGGGGD